MTDCCIIRDLLPLYEDKAVSSETAGRIRAHLEQCPACRDYYTHVRHVIRSMQQPETAVADNHRYDELARRIRRNSVLSCLAGAVLLNLTAGLIVRSIREKRQSK